MGWNPNVVLICISLVPKDGKQFSYIHWLFLLLVRTLFSLLHYLLPLMIWGFGCLGFWFLSYFKDQSPIHWMPWHFITSTRSSGTFFSLAERTGRSWDGDCSITLGPEVRGHSWVLSCHVLGSCWEGEDLTG